MGGDPGRGAGENNGLSAGVGEGVHQGADRLCLAHARPAAQEQKALGRGQLHRLLGRGLETLGRGQVHRRGKRCQTH